MTKVSLGTFKPMSDEDTDQFQQVGTDDIELMREAWQRYALRRFSDLVDATQDETVIDATTSNDQ